MSGIGNVDTSFSALGGAGDSGLMLLMFLLMGRAEVISLLSLVYLMMWAWGLTVISSGVVVIIDDVDDDGVEDEVTGLSVALNWLVSVLYCFRLVSRLGNVFCVVEGVVFDTRFLPNVDVDGSRLLFENLGFKITESSLGLNNGAVDSVDAKDSLDLSLPLILILLIDIITGDGLEGRCLGLED